jgi:hypothetical protein
MLEFYNVQWDMTVSILIRILLAYANFQDPCFIEVISCASWNIYGRREMNKSSKGTPLALRDGKSCSRVIYISTNSELG